MLLSRDEEVNGMGLSHQELRGLDWAVAELRRVLGSVDAYTAYYTKTGISGRTVIIGRRDIGRTGKPLLCMGKVDDHHVLQFAMQGDDDRAAVLGALGKRSTWSTMRRNVVFRLDTLPADGAAFTSIMSRFGAALEKRHPDVFARRVQGGSRMPVNYRTGEVTDEEDDQLTRDLEELLDEPDDTTRQRLTQARVGQGKFRDDMLKLWGGACAVTGCRERALIRASHAQPWAEEGSPDTWRRRGLSPRLDPHNGLPLVGTLDLLFDAGLMTFADDGQAIFAEESTRASLVEAGVIPAVVCLQVKDRKPLSDALKYYLEIHRRTVFTGKLTPGKTR